MQGVQWGSAMADPNPGKRRKWPEPGLWQWELEIGKIKEDLEIKIYN